MTRFLKVMAMAVPMLATCLAMASGIAGSAHDFKDATWGYSETCKPCHTPHNAIQSNLTGRLWAHDLSAQTYNYHGGSGTNDGVTSVDAGSTTIGQTDLDYATRLCLSCHDGTVALDSFLGTTKTNTKLATGDKANLGVDLSNDHPVGYKAMYKEGSGLTYTQNADLTWSVTGGHTRYKPWSSAKAAITSSKWATSPTAIPVATATDQSGLDQNGVQLTGNFKAISCVTCHDVHNGAGFTEGLLRISNNGSAMCLACHDK